MPFGARPKLYSETLNIYVDISKYNTIDITSWLRISRITFLRNIIHSMPMLLNLLHLTLISIIVLWLQLRLISGH